MRRKSRTPKRIFVSYNYSTKEGFGFGNTTQFITDKRCLTTKEIREIEKTLKEEQGFKSVVVLNYQIN